MMYMRTELECHRIDHDIGGKVAKFVIVMAELA
jgi:hypothetical protein